MQLLCGDTVFLGFVVSPFGCFLLRKTVVELVLGYGLAEADKRGSGVLRGSTPQKLYSRAIEDA
jgi:hypothetical protein